MMTHEGRNMKLTEKQHASSPISIVVSNCTV